MKSRPLPDHVLKAAGLAAPRRRELAVKCAVPAGTFKGPCVPGKPAPMNTLEARYAHELDMRKMLGEIRWWRYNSVRLKLASGAWYKPDFCVELARGVLEFHETKGFSREAARVRIKVAASLYPMWRFVVVSKGAGGWEFEEIAG